MSDANAAKVYNCPGCGLPFKWPRAMRLHWRRKHAAERLAATVDE